jgi:pimeloyl-ACP methyl ester carboxylesterase
LQPGEETNSYWISNPTSGARLFVQVLYPGNWSGEELPTLVLIPGGAGTIDPAKARRIVGHGFIVVFFDPDGRGASEGQEDLDGHIHQDGLTSVVQATPSIPGVDANRIGLVSFSYGVTMASGALARHADMPVRFLIDWEGPADRYDTTVGCTPNQRIDFPDCSDDAAWSQREALTFIARVRVPYQRLQSETDHVQPDVSHAIDMVNAAVQGAAPWVRLNGLQPNQTYDPGNPPAMLPEKAHATLEEMIGRIAPELFSLNR